MNRNNSNEVRYKQQTNREQWLTASKLQSDDEPIDSHRDLFNSSEMDDEVFLTGEAHHRSPALLSTNMRIPEIRKNSLDGDLLDASDDTQLEMLSLSSPNYERRQSLRDTSPISMASRSSTTTYANSRTATPMMDQTLTAAFRDKIRNRLQTAKHKVKRRSYRDELFDKQETVINEQIETSLQSISKWKLNIGKILDSDFELSKESVSREEAYDFFVNSNCKNEQILKSPSIKKIEEKEDEFKDDKEDDSRLLATDMFAVTDKWKTYQRCPSVYKTIKERLKEEEKCLFVPSGRELRKMSKYEATEDGLYVEKISESKNYSTMKHRIIMEGLKDKFLDDFLSFHDNSEPIKKVNPIIILLEPKSPLLSKQYACSLKDTFEKFASKYQLIVKIISLQLNSHNLFSEEQLLTRQVINYYDTYKTIKEKNEISIIWRKLQTLFKTANDLNSEYMNNKIDISNRIEINKKLLLDAYNEINEKLKTVRNTLISLLNTWNQLQRLRDIQGYAMTEVKLVCVEEEHIDVDEEQKKWEEVVQNAIDIERYLFKQNDEKLIDDYRRDLRNWKQWQRNKRRVMKENSEMESEVEAEPTKPEPPECAFDESEARHRIRNSVLLIDGRLPGEPKFSSITLEFNESKFNLKDLPKSEQKKQNELFKCKYYVQIAVNEKVDFQTSDKECNHQFIITCNQSFIINISNSKSKFKLIIKEKHNLGKSETLGELYVGLPDSLTNSNNAIPLKLEFAYDRHLNDSSNQPSIRGVIEFMIYWQTGSDGALLCPPNVTQHNRYFDNLRHLETLNADQLQQLMQNLSFQDPNDPNNVILVDAIKKYMESSEQNESQQTFNCGQLSPNFQFVSDEEIENNPRFRLLGLRWQGVPKFKTYKFVPLNEKEISTHLFDSKEKSEISLKKISGFEAKREKAVNLFNEIREQLIKQSKCSLDRPKTLEDMVIEDDVPNISMIGFTLLTAAQNKRPLNPYRRERKKLAVNMIKNLDIKIIITIMHAMNVPVRHRENEVLSDESDNSGESKVCPFVEAVFQRESARTNTAEGHKPTWNETLGLRFKPSENDCSPSNLAKISDFIYLNLFDEILIKSDESITDDGQKVVRNRTERRWMGSLRIPFSTLYLNCKIEGTFRLNTPSVLIGYEYDNNRSLLEGFSAQDNAGGEASKHTYLTLFLTIDPSLALSEPLALKCDTNETESVTLHCKRWENKLRSEYPGRNIKALTVNMNSQLVLVTRYLRPLKPSEELLGNMNVTEEVMHRLARFVSLIPKVSDSIALPGICDIWCSCDYFLDMMMGDEEEHAILLCNYLLYMGKRAAVVLGNGLPEGSTAYVIVFEYTGQDPHLWNASSGERFSVRDSYLPLNSIGSIIFPDNVYANIAKHEHPNRLNYEMTKSSNWMPLFSKNFAMPLVTSIQPENLDYGNVDNDYALELQDKIEKHLCQSLMRWRRKQRTFFNRHCIQAIRKILPRFERKAGRLQRSDLIQDLHDILLVHQMTGFPLNMPFTNLNSIDEAVFATGVHLSEDKNVEFALAVYVHPYPSSIFSIWVYVAALTRHSLQ